jgi:hypothetical protein
MQESQLLASHKMSRSMLPPRKGSVSNLLFVSAAAECTDLTWRLTDAIDLERKVQKHACTVGRNTTATQKKLDAARRNGKSLDLFHCQQVHLGLDNVKRPSSSSIEMFQILDDRWITK